MLTQPISRVWLGSAQPPGMIQARNIRLLTAVAHEVLYSWLISAALTSDVRTQTFLRKRRPALPPNPCKLWGLLKKTGLRLPVF